MKTVGVNRERQGEGSDRAHDRRIEDLARELAEAINATHGDEREVLREVAVDLLREQVEVEPPPERSETVPRAGAFNAFGIGIPLFLMGSVLVFLFPLVGLLMFGTAVIMIAWGVGASLVTRR